MSANLHNADLIHIGVRGRRQGEEMARSWIRFANGLPPMPGAKPYNLEEGSIYAAGVDCADQSGG